MFVYLLQKYSSYGNEEYQCNFCEFNLQSQHPTLILGKYFSFFNLYIVQDFLGQLNLHEIMKFN